MFVCITDRVRKTEARQRKMPILLHLYRAQNEIKESTYVLRVGLFLFTYCGSIFYIVASFLLLIVVGILFCFVSVLGSVVKTLILCSVKL